MSKLYYVVSKGERIDGCYDDLVEAFLESRRHLIEGEYAEIAMVVEPQVTVTDMKPSDPQNVNKGDSKSPSPLTDYKFVINGKTPPKPSNHNKGV